MILTKTVIIHQKSFTNLSSQLLLLLICQCLPCLFKARLLLTAATSKTNIKLKVTGGFNLSKGDLTFGKKSKTLILLLHCLSQRKKKCVSIRNPSLLTSSLSRISFPYHTALPTLVMNMMGNSLHYSFSAYMEAGSWGSNVSGHRSVNQTLFSCQAICSTEDHRGPCLSSL